MKTRRHVPERERPGRHVQLRLRLCPLLWGEPFLFVLVQSPQRSQELRSIAI